MQGLILAAGMGKRLKELTKDNTKCMVKVNGITLCERVLRQLDKKSLSRIVIVVGYKGKELIDYIKSLNIKTPIKFIDNPIYDKTNNIYSLSLAENELLEDDTLLLESDLIFEDEVIDDLLADPRPTLALVDRYEAWMDGTVLTLDETDHIKQFIKGSEMRYQRVNEYYKTVNIYKFSKQFSKDTYVPFLKAYLAMNGVNEYYEQVLRIIVGLSQDAIQAKRIENNHLWYEIDDVQDLDIASGMFDTPEEKLIKYEERYGGYWRYPHMLDYCYLVNPFYPTTRMMYEMEANFRRLLTQYPSGMKVNSLLVSKNFGVKQEYIVVGNGAAELIKSIMGMIEGPYGYIRPTFEEYPNRRDTSKDVTFISSKEGFKYDAKDLIEYFEDKNIKSFVLINPDNPTGNYIRHDELLRILDWSKNKDINMIIDESFVDFSSELNSSLIDNSVLEKYPNLIVVKSISKSYGVPGLRLGILCSSNKQLIADIKKDVSIWNINSFAEFYLQIAEKYQKDYVSACDEFKKERIRFKAELDKISSIKVYESEANYFLIKLGNISAKELSVQLLQKDILIKDLTKKIGKEYIRIAIRDRKDNDRLIEELKKIL